MKQRSGQIKNSGLGCSDTYEAHTIFYLLNLYRLWEAPLLQGLFAVESPTAFRFLVVCILQHLPCLPIFINFWDPKVKYSCSPQNLSQHFL